MSVSSCFHPRGLVESGSSIERVGLSVSQDGAVIYDRQRETFDLSEPRPGRAQSEKMRRRFRCSCIPKEYSGSDRGCVWTYGFCDIDYNKTNLPSDDHSAPVSRPADRQSLSTQLYSLHTRFTSHIPEFAGPVAGNGSQLGFLDWVPRHALNRARVTAKLGTVLHLRLLWVPYTECAVCRTSGYQMPRRVPCNRPNAGDSS